MLKDVRRAIARGGLTDDGYMVAETFHLLEVALRGDLEVKAILAAESVHLGVRDRLPGHAGIRLLVVADSLFQKLAGTESSQGVITLANPPAWNLEDCLRGPNPVVVLDGLQDPDNAGARSHKAGFFRGKRSRRKRSSGYFWTSSNVALKIFA
jgi:tRNA G18 (ribose-2'-O)-methylase SpoU